MNYNNKVIDILRRNKLPCVRMKTFKFEV
jgi:hypothetical protein